MVSLSLRMLETKKNQPLLCGSAGVYANLTIQLYMTFDSTFFRVYGAIYTVATLLLWIGVATRTAMLIRNRRIFEAPCLEDMDNIVYGFKSRSRTSESRGRS